MRQTIFISHAAPEDDDIARWLSLQLIGFGYEVWCDVLKLKGGEDWWPQIEHEIRNNSIKYLVVLSNNSNHKDGVLKEVAVAQKVKKQLDDSQFVIPLHIDSQLSYDDINVELIRLNSINFKNSWAEGLKNLLDLLNDCNIPKLPPNYNLVSELWQSIYLSGKQPIKQEEIYFSNWFPIVEIPKLLRFHQFKYSIPSGFNLRTLPYPVMRYKDYLATFAYCYDFMQELPKTTTYSQKYSEELPIDDIISGTFNSKFIRTNDAKKIIVQLLNMAFENAIQVKPVSVYPMSNKISFWIKKGILAKDKFNKVQLVGKQKEKHWHFGISGNVKLFPQLCFVINSHIWFTSDGEHIIPITGSQHAARRKQGKGWWNNDWRNKNIAFIQFLSEPDGTVHVPLGSEELAKINSQPILFKSPVMYNDPNKENLPGSDYDFETVIENPSDIETTEDQIE